MNIIQIIVMFLHIGAAITWIGGLAYLRFILLPALGRAAPAVRGPLVVDVGPRTVRLLLRAGEMTIFFGLVNFFVLDGLTKSKFDIVWGGAIALGLVGALAIYGIGQGVTKPATTRITETVRAVMAGQGPADATAQLEALAARQRQALTIQLATGIIVVLLMAVARFT